MVVYKTTNIECLPDPSYVENATCFLKAVNWNKAVAQMDCDLIFPLSNTSVRIELLKKSYTNRYNPFLINVTVNMCDVIAKRNFIPYGTIFWKILKKYTNVNHSCPFTVKFLYILKMSE
ncbi:GH23712 [Drosophila grimshawi]|uniref:GH23712 n=1 Tax=Drosophila grimshawi TaxID=7222 RepID=B4K2I9_DROGR|nr:GH23712 [Drosophila grimshawi]